MNVSFFATCLVELFRPSVAQSAVSLLRRCGVEVTIPRGLTCCGQPLFNTGHRGPARDVARHTLRVLNGAEAVVAPSGSCAAMIRNGYPELFHDDPALLAESQNLASRTFELTEFLSGKLASTKPDGQTITYQDCCHLLRELGVRGQPRELLQGRGRVLEMTRSDACCGFGGAFSVRYGEVSSAILDEKIRAIEATGASTVCAADLGCLLHLQGGLRRRGSSVKARHIAEILDDHAN